MINNNELRVLGTIENPLFIAKDVAIMLEYSNTKKAIIDHIDTEDIITYKQLNENGGILPPKNSGYKNWYKINF